MCEEKIYDNRFSSVLLFRARANVLGLNDRQHWKKGDTSCRLCGHNYEDLKHFLLDCKELARGRNEELIKRMTVDGEDTVGKVLFGFVDEDLEELKRMLQEMWNIRKRGELRTGVGLGWVGRGQYFAMDHIRGRGRRRNTKQNGVRGKTRGGYRGKLRGINTPVSRSKSLPSSSWEN